LNSEHLPAGFDRTVQACQAAGASAAHRLSAAWAFLAFWHGVRNQFDGLCSAAKQALALAAPQHHLARVYAHMALAGALHWIGEYERTAAHFGPALAAARASGDAALNLFVQRQLALSQAKEARYLWSTGAVSIHALTQAEADLRGALQLTAELAPSNPATFLNIFLGEVLALQGQHAKALALLNLHESTAAALPLWPLVAISAARRAHSLLALGQTEAALLACETSQNAAAQQLDTEVNALVAAARAQVLQQLGRSAEAQAQRDLCAAAHAQWLALRQQHRDALLQALGVL
jgi:ATP/maltotriose-dependent transcriptional regulator MalT